MVCQGHWTQSSGVAVSGRVWVRLPVMTLELLSNALNLTALVQSWESSAFCSTSQTPSPSG